MHTCNSGSIPNETLTWKVDLNSLFITSVNLKYKAQGQHLPFSFPAEWIYDKTSITQAVKGGNSWLNSYRCQWDRQDQFSSFFDMQHDRFHEKLFSPFGLIPGVKRVCKDKIFAFIFVVGFIPFDLICYVTIFWKENVVPLWSHPRGRVRVMHNVHKCLHVVEPIRPVNLICSMTTFRKKQFWPFDPIPGTKGV